MVCINQSFIGDSVKLDSSFWWEPLLQWNLLGHSQDDDLGDSFLGNVHQVLLPSGGYFLVLLLDLVLSTFQGIASFSQSFREDSHDQIVVSCFHSGDHDKPVAQLIEKVSDFD